jgi:amino acid transporter
MAMVHTNWGERPPEGGPFAFFVVIVLWGIGFIAAVVFLCLTMLGHSIFRVATARRSLYIDFALFLMIAAVLAYVGFTATHSDFDEAPNERSANLEAQRTPSAPLT